MIDTYPEYSPEEQKEHREELVAALRSGEYDQTTGTLRRAKTDEHGRKKGYCCLGVACDISGLGRWTAVTPEDDPDGRFFEYVTDPHSYDAVMTPEVQAYYGFANTAGEFDRGVAIGRESLMSLNDRGTPFVEIAAIIEREPEGLVA